MPFIGTARPTPLHVAIVGGGIAGLSAGISLRRAGHIVTIYERSCLNNEVGAAINVPPNASRPLLRWGLDPVAGRFVPVRAVAIHDPFGLTQLQLVPMGDPVAERFGAPFYFAHRVDLHQALKKLATEEEGPGEPVKIRLGCEVAGYDPQTPSISLSTGEVIPADVVVGADGVNSIAIKAVLGQASPVQPQEHYNCCYRFLIPAAALDEDGDPELARFNADRHGKLRIFADNANRLRFVCYPCRDNEVLNFVAMFYNEDLKVSEKEDWHASATKSKMLEVFKTFNPSLLKVMNKATEVKYWPLLYRSPIPAWTNGRMALAGDSAHPMLPHQGQGGAQGLEDGVALGIALSGATAETVPARLAAYERIRKSRASAMQVLSNAGQDQVDVVHREAAKYMGSEEAVPKNPQQFQEFNFGHDVVEESIRCLTELDPEFKLPDDFFQKSGPFMP